MQVICLELCACAYMHSVEKIRMVLSSSHGGTDHAARIMPRRPSRLWTLDREDTNEAFKGFSGISGC